ncbi:hypothetical protein SK128_019233 [Halocaridina rubra]|uniref:BRICHOS domain-containing protein n=1 Tax=Halocaridina rubra TaxID=373956 RepID=A0AAN8ZYL2_HALRR
MQRFVILLCLLGISLAKKESFSLSYKAQEDGEISSMTAETNDEANTIYYSIAESADFEKVETLEDYTAGFAASRVESQEACYLRRLVRTFEEQVSYMNSQRNNVMKTENDVKVMAIPLDNAEEEVGSTLANFCGDLPVYKLVKKPGQETEDTEERRQISITFTRCVLLCFIPVCYTTTLTLPTGLTITFGWFFFG